MQKENSVLALSTEQGLTIRLQRTNSIIAALNQEVVTLGKDKNQPTKS